MANQATQGAEKVRLQLKWHHQFQFAGYYVADMEGNFREEGLEVEIIEGNKDRPPLETVLTGKADFGVSDAGVLQARMSGSPIVVLAAIFQHSPYIVMSRHDSGIRVPADRIDRTIMNSGDQGADRHLAMLKHEGLPIDRITIVPHSWKLGDLIDDEVDAISAYITAEPSQMRARGVESRLRKVSRFSVWLPCHSGPEIETTHTWRDFAPRGHETILLAEDEELVRLVAQRLPTRHGYRVIAAHSGRHALELWHDRADEIDLPLTDIVMPEGVSGTDRAQRLRAERPDLKVIYTSGYAAEIFRGEVEFPESAVFIPKPHVGEELLGTLRSVLDGTIREEFILPA